MKNCMKMKDVGLGGEKASIDGTPLLGLAHTHPHQMGFVI